MRQPSPSVRKVANATRRALRHPGWLRETVRGRRRMQADVARGFSLADHAEHLCSVAEAFEAAFGLRADEYRSIAARIRVPPAPPGADWAGAEDMLTLTGVEVLRRAPSIVVETGVAMGFTTAVILAAMDDNAAGALHSIDLPPLQVDAATFVGQVVPATLRHRWTLHVGPSRLMLPRLARRLAPIDVFVHDGDHSYAGQLDDYRAAWPHLARGASLISDDVCNPAFIDFAAEVGQRPYLMAPRGHNAAVGLLVKAR